MQRLNSERIFKINLKEYSALFKKKNYLILLQVLRLKFASMTTSKHGKDINEKVIYNSYFVFRYCFESIFCILKFYIFISSD